MALFLTCFIVAAYYMHHIKQLGNETQNLTNLPQISRCVSPELDMNMCLVCPAKAVIQFCAKRSRFVSRIEIKVRSK